MSQDFTGKNILITGGSKGIGMACARAFLEAGAQVAIVSRSEANLEKAARDLSAPVGSLKVFRFDLSEKDAAGRMVTEVEQALGPLDVLVNSAGAARRYPPEELGIEAWHEAMEAKFFTYIHVLSAVLPKMSSRGRGVIINIIGMGGKVAAPIHLPGGAANSALMLATVGLANVYGPKGIRINAVNPGATMTGRILEALQIEARARGISREEVLAQGQARVPLKRYGTPEDVANLTLFLASDRAAYITGAIVPMDGGANPVI